MKMLNYVFKGLLLILIIFPAQGQEKRIIGLRLGYDVSRLGLYVFQPERKEMEFSADMEVKKNIYPIVEIGQSQIALSEETYDYQADGYYFRAGADRNFLKKITANQYEMLFGGLRYGYSSFRQRADNISVSDPYWGDVTGGSIPEARVNAHWVEVTAGIRGELFKNFFMGWSFRGRVMLHQSAGENLTPCLIPGFGAYNGKRANLGFTYSIFYRIPLYKTEFKYKEEATVK
jgi:hypothetical protein